MTNKDLANLIFPNIKKSIEDYENIYPERDLKEGAKVTRFAPSPTGFLHIGSFMQALVNYVYAKNSGGVFYLRNEDTDQAREIEGSVKIIIDSLDYYGINPDEYEYEDNTIGSYGPYVQSERKEIYHAFIKHLIEIGRAYPCFCTKEELDNMRILQEEEKVRTGYYGRFAKCRDLSISEQIDKIKAGVPYVIRFKAMGDFDKKFKFDDLTKGVIDLPENDQDAVIMKSSNLLPTYHFAHVVDDHLMRTTHVVRGEEWLSSVSLHIEMFKAFGFKAPKYIHTPLILKKDGDSVRKISKRKDPEASMDYYKEKGYPKEAVIEAVMTIINSNYEEWHMANKDKSFMDFSYSPKKMSSSGAFFDLEKLDNISKTVISKMSKEDLYFDSYIWAKKYSSSLKKLIDKDPIYYKNVLNIEREVKKPRKDIVNYSDIINNIWFMYDSLFTDISYDEVMIKDKNEVKKILLDYVDNYYDYKDDQDTWFSKIKDLSTKYNYACDMKDYKNDPSKYNGSVADISNLIRVAVTSKNISPNLYEVMKLLSFIRVKERINLYINK